MQCVGVTSVLCVEELGILNENALSSEPQKVPPANKRVMNRIARHKATTMTLHSTFESSDAFGRRATAKGLGIS
jgi:hypothetical protein